jgi:hypothetical protein
MLKRMKIVDVEEVLTDGRRVGICETMRSLVNTSSSLWYPKLIKGSPRCAGL